jgi:hypothetical protein
LNFNRSVKSIFLSSPQQTNQGFWHYLLASNYVQLCSALYFSSSTKQKYNYAFFGMLDTQNPNASAGKSLATLIIYSEANSEIRKKLTKEGNLLYMGTVGWILVSEVTRTMKARVDTSASYTETKQYFLGKAINYSFNCTVEYDDCGE